MRNEVIDITRGVLITLMVVGHSGFPFANIFYLFHMTAFIFVSGFVFNKNHCFNLFIKKRFKSLYLPYVKYNLLFNLFLPVLTYFGFVSFKESYDLHQLLISTIKVLFLGGGLNELIGPTWFLVLLMEVALLYFFLNRFVKNFMFLTALLFVIFILGFCVLGYEIILPRYLGVAAIVLIFYHFGQMLSLYKNVMKSSFVFALISFIILVFIGHKVNINIGLSQFGNPLFFFFASVSGIYLVLFTGSILQGSKISILFKFLGQNTMVILVWHLFFFKILTVIIIYLFDYSILMRGDFPILNLPSRNFWMLYSIIGIAGPIGLSHFTNKCFRAKKIAKVIEYDIN